MWAPWFGQNLRVLMVQVDNSIVMEDADPDAIRLDDLESNASLDEDAVPMRKVTANNRVRVSQNHVLGQHHAMY